MPRDPITELITTFFRARAIAALIMFGLLIAGIWLLIELTGGLPGNDAGVQPTAVVPASTQSETTRRPARSFQPVDSDELISGVFGDSVAVKLNLGMEYGQIDNVLSSSAMKMKPSGYNPEVFKVDHLSELQIEGMEQPVPFGVNLSFSDGYLRSIELQLLRYTDSQSAAQLAQSTTRSIGRYLDIRYGEPDERNGSCNVDGFEFAGPAVTSATCKEKWYGNLSTISVYWYYLKSSGAFYYFVSFSKP